MSRTPEYVLSVLAAIAAVALPAYSQAVISTRSGVVHFFEGAVSVDGQPLEARLGKFANIPEGAELRTAQGRAEVLLTPGVFLRVGENSAIRMLASALSDTRVELLAGSVMVDATEPAAGTSVTLVYKNWNVRQAQKAIYRMDCEPPRLAVREGEVEVSAIGDAPVKVEQGMDLPFAAVLAPEASAGESHDALSDWSEGRAESITADNEIAASIQDPASLTGSNMPMDAFTYFPMLGYPMLGSSLSGGYGGSSAYMSALYGAGSAYQPGFYSMYLPGYTARPLLLGLRPIGLGTSYHPPLRIGSPGLTVPYTPGFTAPHTPGYTLPHTPGYAPPHPPASTLPHPITAPHPVAPPPPHPAVRGGGRH